MDSLVCVGDQINLGEQLAPEDNSESTQLQLDKTRRRRTSDSRWDAHVDRLPPEVKDLLASDAREQSLGNPGQVAVEPRGVVLERDKSSAGAPNSD